MREILTSPTELKRILDDRLPRIVLERGERSNATAAISELNRYVSLYGNLLDKCDIITIGETIDYLLEADSLGIFDAKYAAILRDIDWLAINIRYGRSSIRGITGEVIVACVANSNPYTMPDSSIDCTYRYRFGSGRKEDELAGQDLIAYSDSWPETYNCQVKTVGRIIRGETIRLYRKKHFSYMANDCSRSAIFDRFALVDLSSAVIIHTRAYSELYNLYINEVRKTGCNLETADELVDIPVDDILKLKMTGLVGIK